MLFSYGLVDAEIDDDKKCTSVAGHFDGLADTPVLHQAHRPMEGVQGFIRRHRNLSSGDYLLRFAPAAAMVSIKKNDNKKCTNFSGHFDGRGSAPVRYRAHRLIEEVQGFDGSHWTPPSGMY